MSTAIQWTDETWNPVVGCTKVSQGCKHCYAKDVHDRRHKAFLAGKKVHPQYAKPFEHVQLMPERLDRPLRWRKPRRVFVNSVSDLFHDDVPDEYIAQVFAVMFLAERHTFQVLTKRPARMRTLLSNEAFRDAILDAAEPLWSFARLRTPWALLGAGRCYEDRCAWINGDGLGGKMPPNIWLGVSVETQAAADERIPLLLQTPAVVRFLSCEPLLGPLGLSDYLSGCPRQTSSRSVVSREMALDGGDAALEGNVICEDEWEQTAPPIDWVIIGGESGCGAREFCLSWAEALVADCAAYYVPCFVKQFGREPFDDRVTGSDAPLVLRDRHGGDWDEWPEDLRVRQFPRGVLR